MCENRAFERVGRELNNFSKQPPPWGALWPLGSSLRELEARLAGPEKCCYEGGLFRVSISIPDRYPDEPPVVRFITPIYHPNIDNRGRICHYLLHSPPKGSWDSRLSISSVLLSIVLLMAEPNPDDGLMTQIAREFKESPELFNQKAKDWTQIYAASLETESAGPCRKRRRSVAPSSRKRSCSLATIDEGDVEQQGDCQEISSKLEVSTSREYKFQSSQNAHSVLGTRKNRKGVRWGRSRRNRIGSSSPPNNSTSSVIVEVVDAMDIEEDERSCQKQRLT